MPRHPRPQAQTREHAPTGSPSRRTHASHTAAEPGRPPPRSHRGHRRTSSRRAHLRTPGWLAMDRADSAAHPFPRGRSGHASPHGAGGGAASCSGRQAAGPASAPPTEVPSALPDPADPRRERRRSGIPAPPCLTLRQARRILGTRGETGHSLRRLHAQRHHRTHKADHRQLPAVTGTTALRVQQTHAGRVPCPTSIKGETSCPDPACAGRSPLVRLPPS